MRECANSAVGKYMNASCKSKNGKIIVTIS